MTEVADTQEACRRKKKALHMQGGAYGISGVLALGHHKDFADADTISKTQGVGVVTDDPPQQRGGVTLCFIKEEMPERALRRGCHLLRCQNLYFCTSKACKLSTRAPRAASSARTPSEWGGG